MQREVRFHYQWVLVNDFLPRLIWEPVLKDILPHHYAGTTVRKDPPRLAFFDLEREPVMPHEFAAAAYRFGHSMVRPGYRLNETAPVLPIFGPSADAALTGFHEFRADWAIDWAHFADLEVLDYGDPDKDVPGNKNRLQLAYKIDTSLVDPLGTLPNPPFDPPLSPSGGPMTSLAQRNLLRGWRMRLPTGQSVARAMGVVPLPDGEIKIGKFTGDPTDTLTPILEISPVFKDNCPLWTYVLAETKEVTVPVETKQGVKSITTRQLGEVGGRIVAETFVGLLLADETSYFNQDPTWTPHQVGPDGRFGLRDLVRAALQA